MLPRLDAMDAVLRKDNAGGDAASASAAVLARSDPRPSEGTSAAEESIAELERASGNVHTAFLRQLRRGREVSLWPMPQGYLARLASPYLAQVCETGVPGVVHVRRWITAHRLERCTPSQGKRSFMRAVDGSLVGDDRDVLNLVAFEILCRRDHELGRAYEEVWKKEDWRRPEGRGAAKGKWRSPVKWGLCVQYDLNGLVDAKAQESVHRDTAFHKYYSTMSTTLETRGPEDGAAP